MFSLQKQTAGKTSVFWCTYVWSPFAERTGAAVNTENRTRVYVVGRDEEAFLRRFFEKKPNKQNKTIVGRALGYAITRTKTRRRTRHTRARKQQFTEVRRRDRARRCYIRRSSYARDGISLIVVRVLFIIWENASRRYRRRWDTP